MQRIYNLDKWFRLEEGKRLAMNGGAARKVRLEVNSPAEVSLYAEVAGREEGQTDLLFLALVKARDTVEFYAPGDEPFGLLCEGASCFIYTVDGIDVSAVSDGSESYVRIMERKPRNYDLELMQYTMRQNMQRMLDGQAAELERVLERRLAARAALDAPKGDASSSGAKQPSDGDGKSSDKQPVKAGGGSQGDGGGSAANPDSAGG